MALKLRVPGNGFLVLLEIFIELLEMVIIRVLFLLVLAEVSVVAELFLRFWHLEVPCSVGPLRNGGFVVLLIEGSDDIFLEVVDREVIERQEA